MNRVCAVWSIVLLYTLKGIYANDEVDALIALRGKLQDPKEFLLGWHSSSTPDNPCSWSRVSCNNDNKVLRLDLGQSTLSGELAPELGNLTNLEYLEIYNNNIYGSIPTELGKLSKLMSLDLYNNNLTGPIPVELAQLKSLVFIRLNDNNLSGTVPAGLNNINLPNLTVFDISNNPNLRKP